MATQRDVIGARAVLDREWAAAREWFKDSDSGDIWRLREMLVADEPGELIAAMTASPDVWGDVVQRLALLCLDQVALNDAGEKTERA